MWISVTLYTFVVSFCLAEDRKCCPPGYVTQDDEPFDCLDILSNTTSTISLKCNSDENSLLLSHFGTEITFNELGQLLVYDAVLDKNKFCMTITNNTLNTAVVCLFDEEPSNNDAYLYIVSSVFLLLTAVVYAALPDLRDLQGKSISCNCICLCLGMALFAYLQLDTEPEMTALCVFRGFATYFLILSAWVWMGAISIQILLQLRRPTANDKGWRGFLPYGVGVWGLAAACTVVVAIINFHPSDHNYNTKIGYERCFFAEFRILFVYFYSVLFFVLVINFVIFVFAAISLWKSNSHATTTSLKYRYFLMLKVLIIMSLPWVIEILSASFGPNMFWSVVDKFTALQGPLIFLFLVVLRKRALKALHRRGWLPCCHHQLGGYLAQVDDAEDQILDHTVVPLEEQ